MTMTSTNNRSRMAIAALVVLAVLAGCVPVPDSHTDGADGRPTVADAFDDHGIAVIDDVEQSWPDGALMASPASAVDVMQAEVDSGGGLAGTDLDELTQMPGDAAPMSFVVAAWLSEPTTPRAMTARAWFPDDIDWSHAPSLWYPRAALLLFVADIMEASIVDFGVATTEPQALGQGVTAAGIASASLSGPQQTEPMTIPAAPCSLVSNFFAKTLDSIFSAIQLPPDFLGKGGVLGAISGFLASVYATALQLAKRALVAVIDTLTAPILRALGSAIAIVGVVSHFSTYLLGVSMTVVDSERPSPILLDGRSGRWVATINSNRPLEAQLRDCLAVLGQEPLPSMVERGATVQWRGFLPRKASGYTFERTALAYATTTTTVGAEQRIELPWVAGVEPESSQPDRIGTVQVRAEVPKGDVSRLIATAKQLLRDGIASLAANGGPFAPQIQSAIEGLLAPVLARIEAEILGAGRSILTIVGSGTAAFVYREPDPPATPDPQGSTQAPGCYIGSWRYEGIVSSRWLDFSRSSFARFTLDIDASGAYGVRVAGWAVEEAGLGGFWTSYEGATVFDATPSNGGWAVSSTPLTTFESRATLYMPLGNGYALEGSDEGTPPSNNPFMQDLFLRRYQGTTTWFNGSPDGQFGMAVYGHGLRPTAFSCSPDGMTLTITGEADVKYGATVWQFRRF